MNRTIAFLILGVILLAMALIMVNQYVTQSPEPPTVGSPATPPQTAPGNISQQPSGGLALTPPDAASKPSGMNTPPNANVPPWATNLQEQMPKSGSAAVGTQAPSPVAEARQQTVPPPASPKNSSPSPAPAPAAMAQETTKAKVETPRPKTEAPKPKGPKTIKKIAVFTTDDAVVVRIDASEQLAYKTMQLKGPERLVVDLQGAWAIKAPGVPTNKFVSNVRIGKQKDSTRIVIDLRQVPGSIRYIKKDATTVDIRIK